MKKFLLIFVSLLVMGYLIFSASYFSESSRNQICKRFEVVIRDSADTRFVIADDIVKLVKQHDLHPAGRRYAAVNTLAIRDTILTNKLVESAEVYATPAGAIVASIRQRDPVLRVISGRGESYYLDQEREIMPVSSSFAVYVPIATGDIDEEFAQNELFDFALFLHDHPDWDAWIEQIVVQPNRDVELIPRIGDFRIILGQLDDYPAKLSKFVLFVEEGLNVVGWNRYAEINLKYENQVVCTRR